MNASDEHIKALLGELPSRDKERRAARKASGICVRCPAERLNRASPGKTLCVPCARIAELEQKQLTLDAMDAAMGRVMDIVGAKVTPAADDVVAKVRQLAAPEERLGLTMLHLRDQLGDRDHRIAELEREVGRLAMQQSRGKR